MANLTQREVAARNKQNYVKAKDAFNKKEMDECMSYYALDHQISSRNVGRGREHIRQFLTSMHETWPDLRIVVEHAVAEDTWVMGRCKSTAVHSNIVLGVEPTNRRIEAAFWDLHRFNEEGQIVETWNITDGLVVMQQLGLLPSPR